MRNTTFKEDLNTTLANFGKFTIVTCLTILSVIVRGITIALCHNWILVAIYKLPEISHIQGYALSIVLVILKGYHPEKDEPKDESKWYKRPLQAMVFNGFGILMIWIIAKCI